MSKLGPKPADDCRYDIVALGEVMLRFDPGDSRIAAADSFKIWEGGGEYNVAHGLSHCFGMKAGFATALVDNALGRLIEHRMLAGGVDTRLIKWLPDDGIGESRRNSIYFLERGFGLRPAMGVFDRGHSAIAQVKSGAFDWDRLFGHSGVRWFHSGGIMAGLSLESSLVLIEAMKTARQYGVTVSYDLNYRPSLWKRFGGIEKAKLVNRELLKYVDVLFGLESLEHYSSRDQIHRFRESMARTAKTYPQLKIIASSIRFIKSANFHDWSGLILHDGDFLEGMCFEDLGVYDRVGAGDGFAAGIIYGLLNGADVQESLNFGVAHGALVMTTPGDTTMATLQDVENVLHGRGIGVLR